MLRDRRDDEQRGSPCDATFNVAEIGAVNMGEPSENAAAKKRALTTVARVKILDRVGACRADCGVYYCCFQCSSFAVLRMDRVYNIAYIYIFNSIQFILFPAHINISYNIDNVHIMCRKRGGL